VPDVHPCWFVALDESGDLSWRTTAHAKSLGEVVACSVRNDGEAALPAAGRECSTYSGACSVAPDSDDRADAGLEGDLGESFLVPGRSGLYNPSDVGSRESCCDLRDSRSGAFSSRRWVDDYLD
jgi:hypothetical protein